MREKIVEAMARAIFDGAQSRLNARTTNDQPYTDKWEDCEEHFLNGFRIEATDALDAALKVMMEPDEAMVDAGRFNLWPGHQVSPRQVRDGLQAILSTLTQEAPNDR